MTRRDDVYAGRARKPPGGDDEVAAAVERRVLGAGRVVLELVVAPARDAVARSRRRPRTVQTDGSAGAPAGPSNSSLQASRPTGSRPRDRVRAGESPARRGRRVAHDELRGQLDPQRLDPLTVDQAGQEADRRTAELLERLAHRRQRRRDDRSPARSRRSRRSRDPPGTRRPRSRAACSAPDGHVVVRGEDRGRRLGEVEQARSRPRTRSRSGSRPRRRARASAARPAVASAVW